MVTFVFYGMADGRIGVARLDPGGLRNLGIPGSSSGGSATQPFAGLDVEHVHLAHVRH